MKFSDNYLECEIRFAEGNRKDFFRRILKTIKANPECYLYNHEDSSEKGSFQVNFITSKEHAVDAAFELVAIATEMLDLREHKSKRLRLGATDTLHFAPIKGIDLATCSDLALALGNRVALELSIPVYLFGEAAARDERKELDEVRFGEFSFSQLEESIKATENKPDIGEAILHPSAGAIAIGARGAKRASASDIAWLLDGIKLRSDLLEFRPERKSTHIPTKIKGYAKSAGVIIFSSIRSTVISRGLPW